MHELFQLLLFVVVYGVHTRQDTGCSISSPEEVLYLSISNPGFLPTPGNIRRTIYGVCTEYRVLYRV